MNIKTRSIRPDLLLLLLLFTASRQMQKRVEQLVTDSFGPQFYGKALDCLKALREQSIKVWYDLLVFSTEKNTCTCNTVSLNLP